MDAGSLLDLIHTNQGELVRDVKFGASNDIRESVGFGRVHLRMLRKWQMSL